MKNLFSYCGLVDARIRASNKDLPVIRIIPLHFVFPGLRRHDSLASKYIKAQAFYGGVRGCGKVNL